MSNLWPLSPPLLGPLTFYIPIPPLAYPRCFKHMVFFFIYWGRVDFQCHANLCCTAKWLSYTHISSVSHSCLTLCDPMDAACQACLSITNFQSLLKLMSIELMMPSNHLILCHPLLFLPSRFPSIRVFPMCWQMFFWNPLLFSIILWMLAVWSLVPLPFRNPVLHLKVFSSCTVEASPEEFWELPY